jgi:predicted nuclease of predicted toxin-antitoxin system
MKFKLDENLPGEGVQILRAEGHDAVTVLDQGLGGKPDPEIFAVVQAEGRALITLDVAIAEVAAAAVDEPVTGKLWIVEDGRLRIRG